MNQHSTPNFASILDEAPTEVVRPPTFPKGTYLCVVGKWESGESSKKKTPFVKFDLKPLSALDDVDPEELEAFGSIADRMLSTTYYVTPDAVFMLDEFHQNCGLELDPGTSRLMRNDAVFNQQVLAVVEHEIDAQDQSRVFARIRRTARAE